MDKSEILDLLSMIKDMGCCNMLDRKCLIQTLRLAEESEAANYLESLTLKNFFLLVSEDLSNYLKA